MCVPMLWGTKIQVLLSLCAKMKFSAQSLRRPYLRMLLVQKVTGITHIYFLNSSR